MPQKPHDRPPTPETPVSELPPYPPPEEPPPEPPDPVELDLMEAQFVGGSLDGQTRLVRADIEPGYELSYAREREGATEPKETWTWNGDTFVLTATSPS